MNSRRSLAALDWLNFFMADVETGVGPFVSMYLAYSRHWNPAQVGMVVSTHSIVSVLAQTPAGWIVDNSRHKRWLVVAATVAIALGCIFLVKAPSVPLQIANQCLIGSAVVFVSPAIAAISLGIVGREKFSYRVGRNSTFSHAGNMSTALLAGFIGYKIEQQWIFYVCAGFGLFSIAAALLIRPDAIDNELARAASQDKSAQGSGIASFRDLLKDRRLVIFTLVVVVFHIANAGMLPLAGQELAKAKGQSSSLYVTACIVIAQLTMVPVAFTIGRMTGRIGRKPILLVGFAVLVMRGVFFAITKDPVHIVSIQILDGIGTNIAEVMAILIISDLAQGTGRFNFLQGAIQAAVGVGAFCSNFAAGWVAKSFGFPAAFLGLSTTALIGLAYYAVSMPETLDRVKGHPEYKP